MFKLFKSKASSLKKFLLALFLTILLIIWVKEVYTSIFIYIS
jgi:hypothetical protein